jgi:N-acyl-D-aspartate/D-glutamate deacylase
VAADLIIKGAMVADGSGLPSYRADVVVDDGRIVSIGRSSARADRVIEADGLVLAPGFIDLHTHYDAQLHFEPLASPSSWHGVTTVLAGLCGFSLAPSKPDDLPWLMKMLSRVEGMSASALASGVDFAGGSFADFLDNLEGRIGVNFGCLAGHAAIRRHAMGEAASERAASPDEIDAMTRLLADALEGGAMGFSSSQLHIHADHLGRPVPPNWAAPEELIALAGVLGRFDHGVIGFFPETMGDGYGDRDRALMLAMSEASGFKPMLANPLATSSRGDAYLRALAFADEARADGHRIHPQYVMPMQGLVWSLDSTFIFDEMATFREVLSLQGEARLQRLGDQETRREMKAQLDDPTGRQFVMEWDKVRIVSVQNDANREAVGVSLADFARRRNAHVLDALLDLVLTEDLKTVFAYEIDPDEISRAKLDDLIRHPVPVAGSSDGGAHLLTFCGADYTTRLLLDAVPRVLTLEQAISRLTYQPAVLAGLWDRGLIRPGYVADLVLFDPDKLGIEPLAFRSDFPTGAERLVVGAAGYHALVVGGQLLLENGEDTGARPGAVLRNAGRGRAN